MRHPQPLMMCPVCGSDRWQLRFSQVWDYISDERFDVVSCTTCGLAQTTPMPGDGIIERYYSARYRGDRHAFTDRLRIALRGKMLMSQFPSGFTGRFLDIGCGWGEFALAIQARGWRVSVTEINTRSLDKLRAAGVEARTPQEAMRDGFGHTFDAITCWHVLEHVMRPDELVSWARQILAPGGLFQVTVPNLDSWQARSCGARWLHLDVPRHRYHFTPQVLERILASNGFSVIDRTTFAFEYDWFGWIQSALNAVCSRPNVLFERLTSQARRWPRSAHDDSMLAANWVDIGVSCLLAGPLAAATLPVALLSWLLRGGATLTMTCRATSS